MGAMIRVTPRIALEEGEIEEHYIRASGPGGQNVKCNGSRPDLCSDNLRDRHSLSGMLLVRPAQADGRCGYLPRP
jgi:ribosome-associated protein